MPSVYDYRHIELDRVGSGKKRIVKPSTSESVDIFGRKMPTSPNGSIISSSSPPPSPASSMSSLSRKGSFKVLDTKSRLFGPAESSTRRVRNHMKSNIFSTENLTISPTPSKQRLGPVRRNPITGEILDSNCSLYGSDGLRSPDTASLVNGHCNNYTSASYNGLFESYSETGSELGSTLSITSTPVTTGRTRQPPGGKCSAAWSTV